MLANQALLEVTSTEKWKHWSRSGGTGRDTNSELCSFIDLYEIFRY